MGIMDSFTNLFRTMRKSEPETVVKKVYLPAYNDVNSTPVAPSINQVIDVMELYRSKYLNYSYAQMSKMTPIVRNIQANIVLESFKNGFYLYSDYQKRCKVCDADYMTDVDVCEVCGSTEFLIANPDNKERIHKFKHSCNRNGDPLKKILKAALLDATRYDEAYILKYYIYEIDEENKLVKRLQYVDKADPTLMHQVKSRDGILGVSLQGALLGFCPVHRELTYNYYEKKVCPKCGTPLLTADYWADYSEKQQTKIYYNRDEIIRFSLFEHNSNFSMVETLGKKITSLNAIDQLLNDVYVARKVPNRALFFKTNDVQSIIESDERNADMLKQDKNFTPKYAITSDASGEFVQVVDMLGTIDDLKLIELQDKYEKDIASAYQSSIKQDDRTITVNSDFIKDIQEEINDILENIIYELGVDDWKLILKPNRTEDEANELRLEGLKIQNATGRANLGFKITAYDEERKEYIFEDTPSEPDGQMNFSSFSSNSRGLENTFGNLPGQSEMKTENKNETYLIKSDEKKKVYLSNPSEAPSGVKVEQGSKGGYFYYPQDDGEDTKIIDDNPQYESLKELGLTTEDLFNKDDLSSNIKKYANSIGIDNETYPDYYELRRKIYGYLWNNFKPIIISNMKKDFDIPGGGARNFYKYLGFWGTGYLHDSDNEGKLKLIEDIREALNNDVKKVNTVLKYMGIKERIKTGGIRENSYLKTSEQIIESLQSKTIEGIEYKISPTFIKNSTSYKNEEEFLKSLSNISNALPNYAKELINNGKTKVYFVTRPEAEKISPELNKKNVLGYYIPGPNSVYIYPDKDTFRDFNLDQNKLLAEGYDISFIKKAKYLHDKLAFENVVIHELSHATSLNNDEKLQTTYDDFVKLFEETEKSNDNYITNYCKKNTHEDFAETMSYYASFKEIVESELNKQKSNIFSDIVLKKLRFMRDNLWK